jgi:hypothetical protein
VNKSKDLLLSCMRWSWIKNTYYWDMDIMASIVTQKSSNLERQICEYILCTSPILFPLELFLIQLLKIVSFSIRDSIKSTGTFPPNSLSIPIPLVSSSPRRHRCMVIPLPRILTYTKSMLVHALYASMHGDPLIWDPNIL